MGNNESNENSQSNKDMTTEGNLNIYIVHDNSIDENMIFYLLVKIFKEEDKSKDSFIQLEKKDSDYYREEIYFYHYRRLKYEIDNNGKKDKKIFNAYLFYEVLNQDFSDILINHLYEKDRNNKRNNIIICFGSEEYIQKSLFELKGKSKETIPFLIIISDKIDYYEQKLNYVNYIPDFLTEKKNILKEINNNNLNINNKGNLEEAQIIEISEKAFIYFITSKLYRIFMYYEQIAFNLNMINPLNDINSHIKFYLTIALLGYSGTGKSTLINLLFKDLVCKISPSIFDVTNKCTEYYLPIKNIENQNSNICENIGQIRILDFPGITENENYGKVKNEIVKKINEYKDNMEQIDIALFYIPNGNIREFTKSGIELIKLLHKNNIRIIFIINGPIDEVTLNLKKQKLKNSINDDNIVYKDYSNIINTDYYQYFDFIKREGVSKILLKILEIIKLNSQQFLIDDINVNNYNDKITYLRENNSLFKLFKNTEAIQKYAKIKANWSIAGYAALTCTTSILSFFFPFIDTVTSIGSNVAMIYNIFSIYELNPKNFSIVNIILTNGKCLFKNKKNENNNENDNIIDNYEKYKEELKKGKLNSESKEISKVGMGVGQNIMKKIALNEANKKIVNKAVEVVIKENEINNIGVLGKQIVNTVETKVLKKYSEQVVVEVSNEVIEKELIKGVNKVTNSIASETAKKSVNVLGYEVLSKETSKETIKEITEEIVIKQGGKRWLINLGKTIPFISTGFVSVMNTYNTVEIGNNLVKTFDSEFETNQERKVDFIKGKVYSLMNICEQIKIMIYEQEKC